MDFESSLSPAAVYTPNTRHPRLSVLPASIQIERIPSLRAFRQRDRDRDRKIQPGNTNKSRSVRSSQLLCTLLWSSWEISQDYYVMIGCAGGRAEGHYYRQPFDACIAMPYVCTSASDASGGLAFVHNHAQIGVREGKTLFAGR